MVIADSTYKQLSTVDVAWAFRNGNGLTTKQVPVERMPTGGWTIDSVQATGATRLHLDGAEVTSFVDAKETAAGTLAATDGLHIGTYRDANDRFFEGTVDDVAVWDRVLTTDELGSLWNAGRGNAVPSN